MDQVNSDASAPDSWDSLDDPGPVEISGEAKNVNEQLQSLNINAKPFVPNVNAPAFVPSFLRNQATEAVPSTNGETEARISDSDEQQAVAEDEELVNDVEMKDEEEAKPIQTTSTKKKKEESIEDKREHINIIFIGHVDAGKSTIGGHVMYLTGQVDKRTLEKYEREAKEKNRETWYLSWALDTNQEERDKVISARKGEFETGFEKGGQTREHAMLAKTAGVKHLVILVNKMDDPTVEWDKSRYDEIQTKLTPFLRKVGFNPKTDIYYMPCSGLTGANLRERLDPGVCTWYSGKAFLEYIDELPSLTRAINGPLRIPLSERYKDMGTIVLGKVESGKLDKGEALMLMPNKVPVEVLGITFDEEERSAALAGDNVKLKLRGIEEEDISPGFVLCSPENLCHTVRSFEAQVVILEHKSIICAGYSAVLHIHNVVEEVTFVDHVAIAELQTTGVICIEKFSDFPQMGRFTLRDEGKTIGIGKVLKLMN
ncbi:Eukaryotic peptide chain release factor GTP-binding subunit ERF3B [Acropora cervicornis]|uniref:Eukaryotic peptide chain release factor GTP-binding subunit ERF3B n=1 Tax=Acropora cervicornis TaxID=6130 RepID=A0AAD9R2G2_ACRCE|nr:Eukaryotic peptide chain release factor GTP-binding subunit ERF3B [Acropora cervicornis]